MQPINCVSMFASAPQMGRGPARQVVRRGWTPLPKAHSVSPRNDATDSYLGFLFQGLFALLLLWDAGDEDSVCVEGDDDVVLEGPDVRLSQLKHSLGTPPDLRVSNVGFWKAIGNWAGRMLAARSAGMEAAGSADPDGAMTGVGDARSREWYLFATVAAVGAGDPLHGVVEGERRDVDGVVAALTTEAERVAAERTAAEAEGARLPHAERAAACAAFLSLGETERRTLVESLTVLPGHFRITEGTEKVVDRLRNVVPAAQRRAVAERLIEWWDRQVALALMGRRPRRIVKAELTYAIQNRLAEHRDTSLPDDFSPRRPTPAELEAERGGNVERQIELVRGGASRVDRALIARWQARGQRGLWIERDVSVVPDLNDFDERLKRTWAGRHGPMCDDCQGLGEDETAVEGRKLLDWAHHDAPGEVPPPRPEWDRPFYAQGMLQQFADELEVGWHPGYKERLGGEDRPSVGTEPESVAQDAAQPQRSAGGAPAESPPSVKGRRGAASRPRPKRTSGGTA